MATFSVLSWNVETFGEKKLTAIRQYVAKVVQQANADLVFFLEGTKYAQTDLAMQMAQTLAELTNQHWYAFGSDVTGKARELPPIIAKTRWPKKADLSAYRPDLLKCYDETTKQFARKNGGFSSADEAFCRESLERAGIIRRDIETYTALFRYDPDASLPAKTYLALGSQVGLNWEAPGALRSYDSAGQEIGYADPLSTFTGRSPFVANLYFATPGAPKTPKSMFPIASFHAPFGDSSALRVAANVGLQRLGTNALAGALDLSAQPQAAVAGDFNINYDSTDPFTGVTLPVPANASLNRQNYGAYKAAGFAMTITEKTSLISIDSAQRNWTDPMKFRANAYDNVIVKTGGPITAAAGHVIDVISDTRNAATNYLKPVPGIPKTKSLYDAFVFVRKNVSDHLPVVCRFTVPDRP